MQMRARKRAIVYFELRKRNASSESVREEIFRLVPFSRNSSWQL